MMKKKDAVSAIRIWDQMVSSTDGSNSDSLDKYIANPLIGSLAPEGILPMPSRIFAKKAYK